MASHVSMEDIKDEGGGGTRRLLASSFVYIVHISASAWSFCNEILSSAERWQVALACTLVLILIAHVWGVTTSLILSKFFRVPIKKAVGVTYRNIKFSPLRMSVSIEGLIIRPSDSTVARVYLLTLFPSADVVSPDPSTQSSWGKVKKKFLKKRQHPPPPGSLVKVESISISFSVGLLRFRPVTRLLQKLKQRKKDNNSPMSPRDENDDFVPKPDGLIRANGRLGNIPGKLDPRKWHQYIMLCGPVPRISAEIRGLRIEIDKVYLAPRAPPFSQADLGGQSLSFQGVEHSILSTDTQRNSNPSSLPLPAAVLPPDYDIPDGTKLPTFDQETVLDMLEQDEIVEADSWTFFLERWLEKARTEEKARLAKESKDREQSKNRSMVGNEDGSKVNEDANVQKKGDVAQDPFLREDMQENDRTNALLRSMFNGLLSSAKITATDISLAITGADSKTVTNARKNLAPHLATVFLAELPLSKRAKTELSVDRLTLSFRDDGSCNAVFAVVGLGVKTWLPPPSTSDVSATSMSEQKQIHVVVPSQNCIVEISGVLSYLIWSTNYDHSWETRKLGIEITASKVAFCMAPQPLHTVLMHLDDFSDPDSPYAEWVSWLSKRRLAASPLNDEEHSSYRMLYMKDRGDKEQQMQKQKKKGEKHQTLDGLQQDSLQQDSLQQDSLQQDSLQQDSQQQGLDLDSEPTPTQLQTGVLDKADAVQLEAMEKRMSSSEIMQQRCAAMGDKWAVPKANREMIQYLHSTASKVKSSVKFEAERGEGNKSHANQRASPFERVYRHSCSALVSLVQQKFDLLSCHVSISLCVESVNLDIPDCPEFSAIADPSFVEASRTKSGASTTSVGSATNDSINEVYTTSAELGTTPIHSTLTLYGLRILLRQKSAVYAERTVIDPKKIPAKGGEVRIVQQLVLSLESARWYPMDSLAFDDDSSNLPRFQDETLCGILYKHPDQTGDPDTMLKLNVNNGVAPAESEPAYIAVECECSDLVVIANPLPLISATEAIAAVSSLPFRDILAEQQLVAKMRTKSALRFSYQSRMSINLDGREDDILKDDSSGLDSATAGENESDGTILCGIHGNVRANIINVSLMFLTDASNIDKGTLECHLSDLSLSVNSSTDGENAQLSVMPVTLSACRLIGSNEGGGKVKLQGQPFKHVMNLQSFQLKYSAKAAPTTRAPLHTAELADASTVETPKCVVEVTGYMGSALFHSSQTINVVLIGCFETIKPIIGFSEKREALIAQQKAQQQQREEEERALSLRTRQEALRALWIEVDTDGSNTLDSKEVENIIVRLYDGSATDDLSLGKDIQQASKLTSKELQRELLHFINMCDPKHGNEISFQEVDYLLFGDNEDDDVRFFEEERSNNVNAEYFKDLYQRSQKDGFETSMEWRGLIYYDDLREYSANSEVFRITGSPKIKFPPPSTWRQGRGIHLFWELYERETGCSRTSLNGQDIAVVQRKLVRSLLNYEFAKFCWKGLVKPALEFASGQKVQKLKGFAPTTQSQMARHKLKAGVTDWQLDRDTKAKIRAGVLDRLLRHVEQLSSDIEQERAFRLGRSHMKQNFHYEIKVLFELDRIRLSSGNSLAFTVPLLACHTSKVNISANGLLQHPSNGGFFVSKPQKSRSQMLETSEEVQNPKNQEEATETQSLQEAFSDNNLHFECILSTDYLNTKHNTIETMIEPFVAFGNISYDSSKKKSHSRDVQDLEVSSLSMEIHCPLVFNINASPSSVETFNLIESIYVDASPESYEKLALEQELNTVRQIWDAFNVKRLTYLSPEQVQTIMRTYLSSHWKVTEGLVTETEVEAFILRFVKTMDPDNDGLISFSDVDHAFRSLKFSASSTFFNSSSNIRLENRTGSDLKYCSREYLEKYSKRNTSASISELMSMFDEVGDNRFRPVSVSTNMEKRTTELQRIKDRLVLSVPKFKVVDEVSVSAHQTLLFPLKRRKSRRSRRVGVHHRRCASGFDPYLAVVPGTDRLDIITLTARSCITVEAQTPIDIRVVCLSKSSIKLLRGRKKRNSKSLIDLSKKHFLLALEQSCDGARIVFEKTMNQGSSVPLPIQSVTSSSYHVLLVKDASEDGGDLWRKPILLTKEFLHNTDHISQINQAHAASGITVQRDHLNVYRSKKSKSKANVSQTGIAKVGSSERKKTAWDTTIQVMPSMVLSNSLPFCIHFRCWQIYREDDTGGWSRDDFVAEEESTIRADVGEDSSDSSDDQTTRSTRMIKRNEVRRHTVQNGKRQNGFAAMGSLSKGGEERLHGIDMNEVLYVQVSQSFSTRPNDNRVLSKLVWTPPMQIHLNKLRTGGRLTGSLSHPPITGQLGDEADLSIDVTLERTSKVPYCNLYCPYWVVNKTGFKMKFKFSGRNEAIHDSGTGGLPILAQCNVDDKSKIGVTSREISTIPLEAVSEQVSAVWWDKETNGELVLYQPQLKERGRSLVDWSDKIGLDATGTVGQVSCKDLLFGVKIETLTGVFHRSNLITFGPQYVIKNVMDLGITIFPVMGAMNDVKKMANYLRNRKDTGGPSISFFNHRLITLQKCQSTICYRFHDLSSQLGLKSNKLRFILMRVSASRWHFMPKWHIVPVDILGLSHYEERDGVLDSICAIVKVITQKSGASTVVNVMNGATAPYKIENRSNTHFLQFVQDDEEGVIVEVPPMSFCSFAWDNPWRKRQRLRVVVVEADKSRQHLMAQAEMEESVDSESPSEYEDEDENEDSFADGDSDKESAEGVTTSDFVPKDAQSFLSSFTHSITGVPEVIDSKLTEYNRTVSPFIKRQRLWSPRSRRYDLSKVGELEPLPCPSPGEKSVPKKFSSILFVDLRIEAGSRVVSFNDSRWHSEQEKLGHMQSGGNWKNASIDIGIEGFAINLIDSFPREVLSVMLRELCIFKAAGSIEIQTILRHLQVDAMIPSARYPIVLSPIPLGVDRHDWPGKAIDVTSVPETTGKTLALGDQYWLAHSEKPIPVFRAHISYLPQSNMTWIPDMKVAISPIKTTVEIDYVLRVVDLLLNSVLTLDEDVKAESAETIALMNSKLQYRSHQQDGLFLSYIENMVIAPFWFEVELVLKSERDDNNKDEDVEGQSVLALNSLGRTTKSGLSAGLLSWVTNVAQAFAHVSPKFSFKEVSRIDQYCDADELAMEILNYYSTQIILQSYKVFFSMQLLGEPTKLLSGYKTGFVDIFAVTKKEIEAGGKDGMGKGAASWLENVVGGTFFALGKVSGGVADVLDSATTTDLTDNTYKPKSTSSSDAPEHAIDGVVQGTVFVGKALTHGVAGVFGNPYRGMKQGSAGAMTKGVVSGVAGLLVAPFVGALGFTAKVTEGIGTTTKVFQVHVIEARCRPSRIVGWGSSIGAVPLPYLKAIAIRVHVVRYQKKRRGFPPRKSEHSAIGDKGESKDAYPKNAAEFKKAKAVEEKRMNPHSKVISIIRTQEKSHHLTAAAKPKLLSDESGVEGSSKQSRYSITFEETVVLRCPDFQLSDVITLQLWNNKTIKRAVTKAKPLAQCSLTMGDIYSSMVRFHNEKIRQKELRLSHHTSVRRNANEKDEQYVCPVTPDMISYMDSMRHKDQKEPSHDVGDTKIPIPPIQEYVLMRPGDRKRAPNHVSAAAAIQDEMGLLKREEQEAIESLIDSDSSFSSDSDSSFFLDGESRRRPEEDLATMARSMENLYGHISLSFFPLPW